MGDYNILPTLIVGIIVAVIIVLAIVSLVRQRKKGGCSCGCEGCSGSASCGSFKASKTKM